MTRTASRGPGNNKVPETLRLLLSACFYSFCTVLLMAIPHSPSVSLFMSCFLPLLCVSFGLSPCRLTSSFFLFSCPQTAQLTLPVSFFSSISHWLSLLPLMGNNIYIYIYIYGLAPLVAMATNLITASTPSPFLPYFSSHPPSLILPVCLSLLLLLSVLLSCGEGS